MSAFSRLILRQQTEERGAFWVVLQVSLASADTCCEQHTARFSEDGPLGEEGAAGVRGRTAMTKCSPPHPLSSVCVGLVYTHLCFSVVMLSTEKYAEGERRCSSERQEEHFKELRGSLVTLLFKANPFLAIIPGFVHWKGGLISPQRRQRCKNKYSSKLSRNAANSQNSFLSG